MSIYPDLKATTLKDEEEDQLMTKSSSISMHMKKIFISRYNIKDQSFTQKRKLSLQIMIRRTYGLANILIVS